MSNNQKVDFEKSKGARLLHILSVLVIVGTTVYLITVYPSLPDSIPTHFNAAGEADDWGGKNSIFISPLIATVLFIGMYVITKYPHTFNFPGKVTEGNAPRIYPVAQLYMSLFNLESVIFLCYIALESAQVYNSLGILLLPVLLVVYGLTLVFFILHTLRLK